MGSTGYLSSGVRKSSQIYYAQCSSIDDTKPAYSLSLNQRIKTNGSLFRSHSGSNVACVPEEAKFRVEESVTISGDVTPRKDYEFPLLHEWNEERSREFEQIERGDVEYETLLMEFNEQNEILRTSSSEELGDDNENETSPRRLLLSECPEFIPYLQPPPATDVKRDKSEYFGRGPQTTSLDWVQSDADSEIVYGFQSSDYGLGEETEDALWELIEAEAEICAKLDEEDEEQERLEQNLKQKSDSNSTKMDRNQRQITTETAQTLKKMQPVGKETPSGSSGLEALMHCAADEMDRLRVGVAATIQRKPSQKKTVMAEAMNERKVAPEVRQSVQTRRQENTQSTTGTLTDLLQIQLAQLQRVASIVKTEFNNQLAHERALLELLQLEHDRVKCEVKQAERCGTPPADLVNQFRHLKDRLEQQTGLIDDLEYQYLEDKTKYEEERENLFAQLQLHEASPNSFEQCSPTACFDTPTRFTGTPISKSLVSTATTKIDASPTEARGANGFSTSTSSVSMTTSTSRTGAFPSPSLTTASSNSYSCSAQFSVPIVRPRPQPISPSLSSQYCHFVPTNALWDDKTELSSPASANSLNEEYGQEGAAKAITLDREPAVSAGYSTPVASNWSHHPPIDSPVSHHNPTLSVANISHAMPVTLVHYTNQLTALTASPVRNLTDSPHGHNHHQYNPQSNTVCFNELPLEIPSPSIPGTLNRNGNQIKRDLEMSYSTKQQSPATNPLTTQCSISFSLPHSNNKMFLPTNFQHISPSDSHSGSVSSSNHINTTTADNNHNGNGNSLTSEWYSDRQIFHAVPPLPPSNVAYQKEGYQQPVTAAITADTINDDGDASGNRVIVDTVRRRAASAGRKAWLDVEARPLTRYLPVPDDVSFDLRNHLEVICGHQLSSLPLASQVTVELTRCCGLLYKLDSYVFSTLGGGGADGLEAFASPATNRRRPGGSNGGGGAMSFFRRRPRRRRWFILDRRRRLLTYYPVQGTRAPPTALKPKDVISFTDIIDVYPDHQSRSGNDSHGGNHSSSFCLLLMANSGTNPSDDLTAFRGVHDPIGVQTRILYLSASSPEAMRVWVDALFTCAGAYLCLPSRNSNRLEKNHHGNLQYRQDQRPKLRSKLSG